MRRRFFTALFACSFGLGAQGCAQSADEGGPTLTPKKDAGADTSLETQDTGAPKQDTGTTNPPKDTGTITPPDTSVGPDPDTGVTPDPDTGAPDTYVPPIETGPGPGPTGSACTSNADCSGGNSCIPFQAPACAGMACTNPAASGGGYNDYSSCDSGNGVCSPDTSTGTDTGSGFCVPKCAVPLAGGAASGCLPGDTCIPQTLASGATSATGSCEGGSCSSDSDCAGDPTGTYTSCQKETLNCVKPASLVTYSTTGTACTISTAGTVTPTHCICIAPNPTTATAKGYCSNVCITGDAAHGCGTGYTCNPLLSTTYFTAVPTGISAYCVKACSTSTGCPTGTTCQSVAGGKFCF